MKTKQIYVKLELFESKSKKYGLTTQGVFTTSVYWLISTIVTRINENYASQVVVQSNCYCLKLLA